MQPSLKVVVYLFLSLKAQQSSILWSVLYHFHLLYHCCHSLSLIAICCHSLYHSSLVVICCHLLYHCHSLYHSLSLVNIRCHSLSLVVTGCTTRLSFYKRSIVSIKTYKNLWKWLLYKAYKGDAFLNVRFFKSLKTGVYIRLIRQVAKKNGQIQMKFNCILTEMTLTEIKIVWTLSPGLFAFVWFWSTFWKINLPENTWTTEALITPGDFTWERFLVCMRQLMHL